MPRPSRLLTLCAPLCASLALSACAPVTGPAALRFAPGAADTAAPDPTRLLSAQTVPPALLLSVPEAVRRAPDGSVIVVCNAQARGFSWGVCSHVSRKLSAGTVTDSPGLFDGGVQNRPESTLYRRHAVIVLDVGVTPGQLPRLRAEAERLKGAKYELGGQDGTYDCTTYQNALQRALDLPDLARRNFGWLAAWLPQDILTGPAVHAGAKVLWVGQEGR